MATKLTHFEVFSRKLPVSGWILQLASEDREAAIKVARELLTTSKACAIKVTKEVLDEDTGEYKSSVILNEGAPEQKVKPKREVTSEQVCGAPQELYTLHAREKIGRVLEDWLKRRHVTSFELLHRPDLAEILEASGTELQHAIQKISIPEAQETGASLHELIRRWSVLVDKATTRLITDGRKKLFPDLGLDTLLGQLDKIKSHPEKAYVLGGAVAKLMANERAPSDKLKALLPYFEALSDNILGHEWAMAVFEAPVLEILSSRSGVAEVLGADTDLGAALCILTRLAAGPVADKVIRLDPEIGAVMPPLTGVMAGFHKLLLKGQFQSLAACASKRLIHELKGPRRLKGSDPSEEIAILRAMALVMTSAGKEQTQREDIMEAFAERSKMLVSADFVDSLITSARTNDEAVDKLIWLSENVVGSANKRQAGRWLISHLSAMKFERDMRESGRAPAHRLAYLCGLQKRLRDINLPEKEANEVCDKVGQIGALIAQDAQMLSQLMRSQASAIQKLGMLLNLASGQVAPLGPLSDQARGEAIKILRVPEVRQAMVAQPQVLAQLMPLIKAAGLAG